MSDRDIIRSRRFQLGDRLCALGITIHVLAWFSLYPLAQRYAEQVWAKLESDSYAVVGYESWEADWNFTGMVLMIPIFIYGPATIISAIAAALPRSRNRRLRVAVQALGINLGIFSVLYILLFTLSKP